MELTWNKLLLFLGFLSSATSESNSHKFPTDSFEYGFESQRMGASQSSAKLLPETRKVRTFIPAERSQSLPETLVSETVRAKEVEQASKFIKRMFIDESEEEEAEQPSKSIKDIFTEEDESHLRASDDNEDAIEITPEDLHYDSKRIRNMPKSEFLNKNAETYKKYSNLLPERYDNVWLASEKQQENITSPKEISADKEANENQVAKKQENDRKIKQTMKNDKPKRRKVLRVKKRPGFKNKNNQTKPEIKITKEQNETNINMEQNDKGENHVKSDRPMLNFIKPHQLIEKETLPETNLSTELPNTTTKINELEKVAAIDFNREIENKQQNHREMNSPDQSTSKERKDYVVTFLRRIGKKLLSDYKPVKKISKPDWVSMYRTEDGDANNNYYVQSFNYRGDRNKEAKDVIKLTQWTSLRNQPQKKAFDSSEKKIPIQKNRNFRMDDARSYGPEKILRPNSGTGKSPVKWNKVTNYKLLGTEKKELDGIHEEQMEKEIVRKVLTENDRAKLDMASISFKKKPTSQNRKPQWQPGEPVHIKSLKKKIQYDENVSERENYENPYIDNEESDNNSFLQSKEESPFLKSKSAEPALSNYDENLKSIVKKSAPSYSTGNENGKYFVHVFRRMGEVSKEDFDINSDEIPEGDGYVSSMKLSWDDDDTNAQIERTIDSWPKVSKTFTREKDFFTRVDESIRTLEDINKKARGNEERLENTFTQSSGQKEDLFPSSTEDDEYHSEDEEYTYRKKRSAEKTHDPYMQSHFTMGKSKTAFQSTLSSNRTNPISLDKHQKPDAGNRLSENIGYIAPAQTHYRNAARQSELNDDKGRNAGNFRSYYHKPEHQKEMKKLAKEFHIKKSTEASPFDKYAKPVRDLNNYQVFHSYQEPRRDQKPKFQIQTFYNFKNTDTKKDRRIFDKNNIKRLQRLKPSYSNLERNNNGHQKLTDNTEAEVQSSGDINKFFFKKGESSKETRDTVTEGIFKKPNEHKTLAEMSSDKVLMEANTNEPVIKTFFRKSGQAAVTDGKKSFSEYDGTRNTQSDMEKINDNEEHNEYTAENLDVESDPRHSPNDGIFLPHDDQNDFPKTSVDYGGDSKAKPAFHFESNDWKHSFSSPEEPEYPRLHSIPKTHFTCKEKSTGYYADPETGCQVFHMCQATGEKHSFLCPNTTVFNQKLLVCDWYSKVKCEKSELFYSINDHIYQQKPSNNEMTTARHPEENSWNWKLRQIEAEVEKTFSTNKDKLPKGEDLQTDDANVQSSPYLQRDALNHNETTDNPSKHTEFKSSRKYENKDYGIREVTRKFNKPSRNTGNKDNLGKEKPLKSRGYDYYKDDENVHLHKKAKPENIADKLSTGKPKSDADEYRTTKNSWDEKELHKTTQSELKSIPESIKSTYDDVSSEYLDSGIENPASQPENSFHSEDDFKSDNKEYSSAVDKEVSRPQKEKSNIILIHKAYRHVDNDSAESREFLDRKPLWDKKMILESASQTAQRTKNELPTYYVRKKYLKTNSPESETVKVNEQPVLDNDDDPQQNEMSFSDYSDYGDVYRNGENNPNKEDSKIIYLENDQRIPRYIYPLPGIIQNDDGSREYNYGFRVEDPQKINLQDAHIFKISFHDPNIKIKTGKQTDYRKSDIKLHKELLNNDENFHKNVRVYNLKPHSFPDETQEIYLAPFSFERQSGKNAQTETQNKFVEQKQLTKPHKIIPSAIHNYDSEIKTEKSKKNRVFDKNFRNAQLTPYGGRSKQTNYNPIIEDLDVPTDDENVGSNKYRYIRPKNEMPTYNEKNNLPKHSERQPANGLTVNTGPVNQNFEILGNTDKAKSLLLKYKQDSQFSDLDSSSEKPILRSYGYTVQMGPFRKVKVPRFENTQQIEEDTHAQEVVKPYSSNKEILNTEKPNHVSLSLDKHIFQENSKPFIQPVSPGATSARSNQNQIVKLIEDTQEPILENQKSDNSQKDYQGHLQNSPELRINKRNKAHKMYYKIPPIQEARKEKFESSHTPQRPQNFVVRIQPTVNTKYVFTDGAKLHKETVYSTNQNSESRSAIGSIKQQPVLKNDESFECEDESDSNQNTFNPKDLQLGKNGPAQKIITNAPSYSKNVKKPFTEVILKGDKKFSEEINDNSASRCNDHSSSRESNIKIPEPNYINAKEKFIARLLKPKLQNTHTPDGNEKLKYPLFPITQSPKTEKEQHEVPLQKRPIKLFDLPRSSHPAAVKYYPVKKASLNDDQIHNDETKTKDAMPYTSSIGNTREEKSSEESGSASSSDNEWEGKSSEESFDIKDQKSSERSKRVAEGKYSKYAELERAAELEAERMIKSKRRNVKK